MAPVLTVVVVASNAESYLSECLDSLRSQTLKRLEVLVVDNGSTDGTVTVAHACAAQIRGFGSSRGPQLGLTASRNAGARLARGKFLAFVDATDTVPRACLCQLDQLAATHWLGLCSRQRTHRHPGKEASASLDHGDP